MIRVNLAKTHNYSSAGTQTAVQLDAAKLTGQSESIKKVVIMIVFPILLYMYEAYSLGLKQEQSQKIKGQLEAVQQEIQQYGSVTTIVEDLLKEKEKLNAQLKVIQTISQKRAFKLKAITKVQESLPDDLWMREMNIVGGIISFKGYSQTSISVQKIVRRLNDLDFITSAINKELKRVTRGDREVQEFNIEARVKQ